jgi:cobalt/nickel transport system ATP-binding protein
MQPAHLTEMPRENGKTAIPSSTESFSLTVPAIEITDLVHSYHASRRILDGVSLTIQAGERLGIIGPTGAGKSTLLLHFNGILLPQQGSVRIGGVPLAPATISLARRKVGLVFQNPDDQLFSATVEEDVAFGPLNMGLSQSQVEERVTVALKQMDLLGFEKRSSHHLSFGEKRRVALATILSMQPEIMAFDEPFANLDPFMTEQLVEIIKDLKATVVIVSQAMLPALACCERLAVLHQGKIVAVGKAIDIARDRSLLKSCGMDFHFFGRIWKQLRDAE